MHLYFQRTSNKEKLNMFAPYFYLNFKSIFWSKMAQPNLFPLTVPFKLCYRMCHTLQNIFIWVLFCRQYVHRCTLPLSGINPSINYLRIFIWNLSHHPFTLIVNMSKPKWQSFILWNMGRQGQNSFAVKWSPLSNYTEAINTTDLLLPSKYT